ncbi:MAG: hypothetical protein Q8910_00485 [Bacteroidota bacterium]|nr:hypothetical protein [Bacteroidota bacterium]
MQGTITIKVPRWQTVLRAVFILALMASCIFIGTRLNKSQKVTVTKIIESKHLTNDQKKNAFVVDRQSDIKASGKKDLSNDHKVEVNNHTMWGFNPGEQLQFPATVDIHTTYTHDNKVIGEGSHSSTGTTTVKFTETGIESSTEVKDQIQEAFVLKQEPKLWEIGVEGSAGTEVSVGIYVRRDFPIYQSEHIDINAYIKGEIAKDFNNNDVDVIVSGGICGRF